jgi:long-chain acyl-CoA synthetase
MIWENYGYPLYEVEERRDLREMLDKTCEKYGEEKSFFEKNKDDIYEGITFNQFRENMKNLSDGIFALNLKERDHIALMGKNSRAWATSYYSITSSNFVVIPIDKELKDMEIERIISISKPQAIFCDSAFLKLFLDLSKKYDFIKFIISLDQGASSFNKDSKIMLYDLEQIMDKGKEVRKKGNSIYDKVIINPDLETSILFTSGTTGTPKGVMLTQHSICNNIYGMRKLIWIDNTKYFLSVLPLHHAYECTCGFLCQVHASSKILYVQSLKKLADNIREGKATNINVVPLLLETLAKRVKENLTHSLFTKIYYHAGNGIGAFFDFISGKENGRKVRRAIFKPVHNAFGGKLDLFISGGAAVKPEISRFLRSLGFRVLQGYGISECSPFLAANRDKFFKDDSAGMPLPEHDFEFFDVDEDGVGEIAVKGKSVMLGYYNDPEATKAAFRDGYFLTGDYGYLDNQGFIHIKGRKKNVIVTRNGKNIYPEDIEVLYDSSSIIQEIIVMEMVEKETNNETICAYIYPNFENLEKILNKPKDTIKDEDLLPLIRAEIRENNQKISAFKRIHYFSISYDEFEKTTTKKIIRMNIDKNMKKYSVYI